MNAAFYMREALNFAKLSIGLSRPNPAVGAVVVRDGKIVGKGRTQAPGSAHAEVCALREAGELANGADIYVTLEPCCHFGRTPPCTSAIIAAKIKRVFFAHADPNPVVRGNSRKVLEEAGIEVFEGVEACGDTSEGACVFEDVERYFEGYDYFVRNKAVFVEIKSAVTKNFKMANADRTPMRITGELANCWTHNLRSISDAILVGASTVVHDNPSLNVRLCEGNSPVKIVLANETQLSKNAKVFADGKTIVYSCVVQPDFAGVAECKQLPSKDFRENWQFILADLSARGMHRLMVEPGATLAKLIFESGLWNRFDLWIASHESEGLEFPMDAALLGKTTLALEKAFGEDLLKVYRNAERA